MSRTTFRLLCNFLFAGVVFSIYPANATANPTKNITAKSWIVADEYGNILNGEQTNDIRSIASITKLMTVIVVLDSKQDLDETLPKKLYNKNVSRRLLIDLALVKSDNQAAKMLCDYYITGYNDCIKAMNDKANELQMYRTNFVDPTGIYNDNVSTAENLIKLVIHAKNYPEIIEASNKNVIEFSNNGKRKINFYNTNNLVGRGINFLVTKTGWIRASGGCIVMMLDTANGVRTVILLGSQNVKTRITEAYLLSNSF